MTLIGGVVFLLFAITSFIMDVATEEKDSHNDLGDLKLQPVELDAQL